MKKSCVAPLFLAGILSGCVSRQHVDDGRRLAEIATRAQSVVVDTSDGISEVEAYKIACDYFFTGQFMACGVVALPKEEKTVWRVPLFEGYAGVHARDVVIQKSDGSYRIEATTPEEENNKSLQPTPGSVTPPAGAAEQRNEWTMESLFARLAKNAAKTAYNCSGKPAPFDAAIYDRILTAEADFMERQANEGYKAPEPTCTSVTPPAEPGVASGSDVDHL